MLWIEDSYFIRKQVLGLKCVNVGFVSYKPAAFHFTRQTGVMWITFWRKHYYGFWTHILAKNLKCLKDGFVMNTLLFTSQEVN